MSTPGGSPDRTEALSDVKQELLSRWLSGGRSTREGIPRRSTGPAVEASFAQRRMWFLAQVEPDSPFYNMTMAVRVTGDLDVPALRAALERLVARHESLRTGFDVVDGQPRQVVRPEVELPLTVEEHAGAPVTGDDLGDEVRAWLRARSREVFDLTRAPLARFHLLRVAPDSHVFLLAMHHIIGDGRSLGVLFGELTTLYQAFRAGDGDPLPPVPVQYADFSEWQRRRFGDDGLRDQLGYWRDRLGGEPPRLRLPTDRPRPDRQTFRGAGCRFAVPRPVADRLRELAHEADATPYMALLAAFKVLLHRYTGQTDLVVGSVVEGRDRPETRSVIGLFANTVVLRTDLGGLPTFREVLAEVRRTCLGAYANQDLPFDHLVAELRPERDLGDNPLFQVMFVMQHPPAVGRIGDLDVRVADAGTTSAQFDLTLHCWEAAGRVEGVLTGSLDLFEPGTTARVVGHYESLLTAIAEDAGRPLHELTLMSAAERALVTPEPPPPPVGTGDGGPLLDPLRASAALAPGRDAVLDGGTRLDHRSLWDRAEGFAGRLLAAGVRPGTRVAVDLPLSWRRVAAVLGTLLAGGACVLLDPGHPTAFRQRVAARAGASVVLRADDRPAGALDVLTVDDTWFTSPSPGAVPRYDDADAPALVWARPTGPVVATHGQLAAELRALGERCPLTAADRVLPATGAGPRPELWSVLWALAAGAAVVVPDEPDPGPAALRRLLERRPVTAAHLLPSTLAGLGDTGTWPAVPRLVLTGGEPLPRRVAEHVPAGLHHLFAPVSTPGHLAVHRVRADDARGPDEPVPFDGGASPWCVVDGHGRVVPVGVVGDLAVRTGDGVVPVGGRGRRLADGALVPEWPESGAPLVAGEELPLAELRDALLEHDGIADAEVLVRRTTGGATEPVAYVVPTGPWRPGPLRAAQAAAWPARWAPRALVPVTAIPLTAAGLPDHVALRALPVVDDDLAAGWERLLAERPGVLRAAAVVEETATTAPRLHLDDLGVARPAHGAADAGAGAAPVVDRVEAPGDHEGAPDSISHGGPAPEPTVATLGEALLRAATGAGEVVYVGADGGEDRVRYDELLDEASRVLAGLRAAGLAPGDKAIFQFADNRDFVTAFWACVLGGVVPVPLGVPPGYQEAGSGLARLENAWRSLGRPWLLTDRERAGGVRAAAAARDWGPVRVGVLEELRAGTPDRRWHAASPEDLALLLLTSGSTGVPKAVALRHRNVLGRCAATAAMNGFHAGDVSFNWMPMDHVGGIVMFHVRDVYLGCRQVHAPTQRVLEDPVRWLDLVDRHRATVTWAPNFAYGLVTDRAADFAGRGWDLSCLRFILNAGEAIMARVARGFLAALEPFGLPATAMRPAWGMSETSSAVTYSDAFRLATTSDQDAFVEVGRPVPGTAVRIVDGDDRLVPEGATGRLQVRGPTVTGGYHDNPEQNAASFTADGWFDTGDLGRLRDGALTITGRAKDVVIINGVNHYSHEIEAVVEEAPCVERSFTAACTVRDGTSTTDQLAIFFHPRPGFDERAAVLEVRARVVREIGVNPDHVLPVPREAIPKTEIGKLQRSLLRERFQAGGFEPVVRRVDLLLGRDNTIPHWFHRQVWRPRALSPAGAPAGGWLVFLDRDGLGEAVLGALPDAVRVEAGAGFERVDRGRYRVDPADADHHDRLFASLADDGVEVDGVLHLWSFGGAGFPAPHGVLHLLRALARHPGERRVDVVVAGSGTMAVDPGDAVDADRAAVRGLLKSAAGEAPALRCRRVDLPADDPAGAARALVAELGGGTAEPEVAYRGGRRLVPRLARVPLPVDPPGGSPIRRGGRYLVTGGLGGLGALLCRHLLTAHDARLLVVGRSEVPEPSPALESLRRLGEVRYAAADVTGATALRAAVDAAEAGWGGPLDGVFHLAGRFAEHLVAEGDVALFDEVYAPKAAGARAIGSLLADRTGCLVVCFSSVNGFFGGATVGAYAAANSHLDAFAHAQRARGHDARSIAWSMWDDIGMSAGYQAAELSRARGFQRITAAQGIASLEVALRHDEPYVVVGVDSGNPATRAVVAAPSRPVLALTGYVAGGGVEPSRGEEVLTDRYGGTAVCRVVPRDALPTTGTGEVDREALRRDSRAESHRDDGTPPRTALEREIAEVWCEVLDLERVGVRDGFFDLGGHSLRMTQLAHRVRERLGVELRLAELFREPTVEGMARSVERARDGGAATTPDLLAEAELDPVITAPGPPDLAAARDPRHVVVTGAAGFLGAFLLDELLARTRATVWCLVRADDADRAEAELRAALRRYRLPAEAEVGGRVRAVPADPGAPLLGLGAAEFDRLAREADLVVHAESAANLAAGYESLRGVNAGGTREVLRLAARHRAVPVHHISTPGVLFDRRRPAEVLFEDAQVAPGDVVESGYVRTRWVAEQLDRTARSRGLPVSVYRPARVGGDSRTGAGSPDASLWQSLAACAELGVVPEVEPGAGVDLVPVDHVARVVVWLALNQDSPGGSYHLAPTAPVPLELVVERLRAAGYRLTEVPYADWVARMSTGGGGANGAGANGSGTNGHAANGAGANGSRASVATLLDVAADGMPAFGGVRLDCRNTTAALAGSGLSCPVVDASVLDRYLRHFIDTGALVPPVRDTQTTKSGEPHHGVQ
ncbi:thioester reductase domain-containing protein [Saccharothrix xinjiangensis]|uniref:Thioester reductase domain-containing protein n=1 Tax=Saccharothrix xinjiangensis TaxID=204798 RepID=A0ABV9Y407_9PSEU